MQGLAEKSGTSGQSKHNEEIECSLIFRLEMRRGRADLIHVRLSFDAALFSLFSSKYLLADLWFHCYCLIVVYCPLPLMCFSKAVNFRALLVEVWRPLSYLSSEISLSKLGDVLLDVSALFFCRGLSVLLV